MGPTEGRREERPVILGQRARNRRADFSPFEFARHCRANLRIRQQRGSLRERQVELGCF